MRCASNIVTPCERSHPKGLVASSVARSQVLSITTSVRKSSERVAGAHLVGIA